MSTSWSSSYSSEHLFVVRESAEYDHLLFGQMLRQILEPYSDRDSVQLVLKEGVNLVRSGEEGDRLRSQFQVMKKVRPGSRNKVVGNLFQIENDWFFLSMSSAAKETRDGTNDFTSILSEIITQVRPERIVTGPASRLVRNKEHGVMISRAARKARSVIHVAEAPSGLDLAGAGVLQWEVLTIMADNDHKSIVRRLLTGTVYDLKHNRWPRNPQHLPLGYVLKEDKTVEPSSDPLVKDQVQTLINLAADPTKTHQEIAKVLAGKGVLSRSGQGHAARPLDEVADVVSAVNTLLANLSLYKKGEYFFTHENPILDIDSFHGFPVHRRDPEDQGRFSFTLNFGVPETPWAAPEVIDAAVALRSKKVNPVKRNRLLESTKPLLGFSWEEGEDRFLVVSKDSAYNVRKVKRGHSGTSRYAGEKILSVSAGALHKSISETLIEGLSGDPAITGAPVDVVEIKAEVKELEEEVKKLEVLAAGFDRQAALAEKPRDAERYRLMASSTFDELEPLQLKLSDLRVRLTVEPSGDILAQFNRLASSLVELGETKDQADLRLRQYLTETISNLRLWKDEKGQVAWKASVRIPTTTGTLTFGPFTSS